MHAILLTVFSGFLLYELKVLWDMRIDLDKLNPALRTRIESCANDYWSLFVVKPLDDFYNIAADLMTRKKKDYHSLRDILDDNDYRQSLEEKINESAVCRTEYALLESLFEDIHKFTLESRKWVIRTIPMIILIIIAVVSDLAIREIILTQSPESVNTPPILTLFVICCGIGVVAFIILLFMLWKTWVSWGLKHEKSDFLIVCEGWCANGKRT